MLHRRGIDRRSGASVEVSLLFRIRTHSPIPPKGGRKYSLKPIDTHGRAPPARMPRVGARQAEIRSTTPNRPFHCGFHRSSSDGGHRWNQRMPVRLRPRGVFFSSIPILVAEQVISSKPMRPACPAIDLWSRITTYDMQILTCRASVVRFTLHRGETRTRRGWCTLPFHRRSSRSAMRMEPSVREQRSSAAC